MIHCNIIEGSFNTELFVGFIGGLLDRMNPFPASQSVIVMDNCAIHKAPEITQLIESRYVPLCSSNQPCTLTVTSRGMKIEYLPPYSPDFNPIELSFSLIKARLRRDGQDIGENACDSVVAQLYRHVYCVSSTDCQSFGLSSKKIEEPCFRLIAHVSR